jgi:hypothetical protein
MAIDTQKDSSQDKLIIGIKTGVKAKKDKTLARDLALIKKSAGGVKSKFTLTPDEMNDIYDKEVYR